MNVRILFLMLIVVACKPSQNFVETITENQLPFNGTITFLNINEIKSPDIEFLGKPLPRPIEREYSYIYEKGIIEAVKTFKYLDSSHNSTSTNFINRSTGNIYQSKKGRSERNILASIDNNPFIETYQIEEFPKRKKDILGATTFLIRVTGTEIQSKTLKVVTNYDLYVTREIKAKYHPILKDKCFVRDYYPLELTITGTMIDTDTSKTSPNKLLKLVFDQELGAKQFYKLKNIEKTLE